MDLSSLLVSELWVFVEPFLQVFVEFSGYCCCLVVEQDVGLAEGRGTGSLEKSKLK